MKHRWMTGLLIAGALTLAACAPTDAGADDESPSPTVEASAEASVEASVEGATPTPTPTEPDEY